MSTFPVFQKEKAFSVEEEEDFDLLHIIKLNNEAEYKENLIDELINKESIWNNDIDKHQASPDFHIKYDKISNKVNNISTQIQSDKENKEESENDFNNKQSSTQPPLFKKMSETENSYKLDVHKRENSSVSDYLQDVDEFSSLNKQNNEDVVNRSIDTINKNLLSNSMISNSNLSFHTNYCNLNNKYHLYKRDNHINNINSSFHVSNQQSQMNRFHFSEKHKTDVGFREGNSNFLNAPHQNFHIGNSQAYRINQVIQVQPNHTNTNNAYSRNNQFSSRLQNFPLKILSQSVFNEAKLNINKNESHIKIPTDATDESFDSFYSNNNNTTNYMNSLFSKLGRNNKNTSLSYIQQESNSNNENFNTISNFSYINKPYSNQVISSQKQFNPVNLQNNQNHINSIINYSNKSFIKPTPFSTFHTSKGQKIGNSKHEEFSIDDYLTGKESRTTIMIRNIPNKYDIDQTLLEIDETGFKNKYNCFYLPIDPLVSEVNLYIKYIFI